MSNTELVARALRGAFEPPEEPSIDDQIFEEFLTPSPVLSSKWNDVLQPDVELKVDELAPQVSRLPIYDPRVQIRFTRKGLDGTISALQLRPSLPAQIGAMAMTRKMSRKKNNVRGTSGQMPFTPGGIDIQEQSSAADLHHNELGLLDIAPGLSRSMRFKSGSTKGLVEDQSSEDDQDEDEQDLEEEEVDEIPEDESVELSSSRFDSIDSLLPPTSSFVRNLTEKADELPPAEKKWAHMVDINKNMPNFDELVPNPARTWPFELDNFQKEAVYHLEQGDSVFIAAHTSAGKTVVAEYAMSIAAQHMTKCIYTSPIKALSNQKYRDFKEEYDDVGILTGDVQLNPDASTLIMTTEILRSMLYRGADIIRDVEFIIFDEVHYVNDNERGVVWEEVIIMLPDHVKMVLLSATVPNTFEFANWVGRTKQKDVYVISTPKRPVPLKHSLWVKNEMLEIVDEHRNFLAPNYNKAQDLISPPKTGSSAPGRGGRGGGAPGRGGGGGGGGRGGRGGRGGGNSGQMAMQRQMGPKTARFNQSASGKNDLLKLTEMLRSKSLLPAVFFVFSRKMAEQYAEQMQAVQLNNGRERSQVYMFMERACARLRKEDRNLPQIEMLRQLLQQGIGLHHSGLLPIMKEVVEILFAKGLVKLLFATETFAMGLNLPTRTVVFTAVRKFDSKTMRDLTPGEYTQMAGRAGRRGLDSVGTVIIMNNNKDSLIPRSSLEQMLLGQPLRLSSQFRLTYNMILSLMRIEALRVEDVIQQSFSENAQFVLRPEREKQVLSLTNENRKKTEVLESVVKSLRITDATYSLYQQFVEQLVDLRAIRTQIFPQLLNIFRFSLKGHFCLSRRQTAKSGTFFDVRYISHLNNSPDGVPLLVTIGIGSIFGKFSTISLMGNLVPEVVSGFNLVPSKNRKVTRSILEASQLEFLSNLTFKGDLNDSVEFVEANLPALFTEFDTSSVKSVNTRKQLMEQAAEQSKTEELAKEVAADPLGQSKAAKLYEAFEDVIVSGKASEKLRNTAEISNTALLPEYQQRVNVLRQANYLDEGLNVALKGRVACEISTGYELYLTELIMDNFLGSYEPEEIVALLSAFVFDGARSAEEPPTVTPRLDEGKERLLELVDYVQKLAIQNQVTLTQDEAEFAEKNRFALMQVVYEWARGMTFSEIIKLTPVQEGLIVRVINRLDEICRSVMNAARIIGEVDLYDKLAIAQERIRRDIVFCSSLYL